MHRTMAPRILLPWFVIVVLLVWAIPGTCAEGADLYDEGIHARAMQDLENGDLTTAIDGFCGMFERPRRGGLWTIAVHLICETENLAKAVSQITGPEPVFAMKMEFEGRCCYRVCAGLTTSRETVLQWNVQLSEELRHAGPFPVKIELCEPSPGWEPLAVTVPAPDPPDEVHGEDYYSEVELVPIEKDEAETPPPPDAVDPEDDGSAEPRRTSLTYDAELFTSPRINSLPGRPGLPPPPVYTEFRSRNLVPKGTHRLRGRGPREGQELLRRVPEA